MTRYLMSMGYPEGSTPPSSDELESIMADITEIRRQLQAEGSWVFGGGLHHPSTATVVRSKDGTAVTTDGPFIDSKEVIGGVTIIDVADLDAALAWAERTSLATLGLPVEVRPFVDDRLE